MVGHSHLLAAKHLRSRILMIYSRAFAPFINQLFANYGRTFTYKALNDRAPSYLKDLIVRYFPNKALRCQTTAPHI